MSTKELLLYSGGPDSSVLLKYFLEQKKDILVVYVDMGWCNEVQPSQKIQEKRVDKLIKYYKKKYGEFDFIKAGITLNIPNCKSTFGTDDQWGAFLGAVLCCSYNIKRIWCASFSYNWANRTALGKTPPYWFLNMKPYLDRGTLNDPNFKDLQYTIPKFFYNGKKIDKFKTKKEAFNYLDPKVQLLVRSCYSEEKFCGECYKCKTCIHHKITDEKGNLI
tara:strand:+ start:504 stop:1160 length:657 start_codon:yes stop_codon:yes gene_type:complete